MEAPLKHSHIKGWGSDLDHAKRPAYPRERTPPRLEGIHWDKPEQQPRNVEILCSIERPGITPVFGTPQPPRGMSGSLRRIAFRYSENDVRHWMLLLLADRINVGEGLIEDLSHGHVPRIYAEMGGRAELKHNPVGAARKALTVVAVSGLLYLWLKPRRRARY